MLSLMKFYWYIFCGILIIFTNCLVFYHFDSSIPYNVFLTVYSNFILFFMLFVFSIIEKLAQWENQNLEKFLNIH